MKKFAELYTEEMAQIFAKAFDDGAVLGAGIIKNSAILIQRRGGSIQEVIDSIDTLIEKVDQNPLRRRSFKNYEIFKMDDITCRCDPNDKPDPKGGNTPGRPCLAMGCINN